MIYTKPIKHTISSNKSVCLQHPHQSQPVAEQYATVRLIYTYRVHIRHYAAKEQHQQQIWTTPHYLEPNNVAHVVVILQTILFLYSVLTNQKICRRNMWPHLLKWPLFCVLRASFVILLGLPSEEATEHFGRGVWCTEDDYTQPTIYVRLPTPPAVKYTICVCVALALIYIRYNGQWFSKCKFVYKVFLRRSVWFCCYVYVMLSVGLAVVTLCGMRTN